MLNTYQVLQQISDVWDDMTNAEKSNLAITLAKKTQMDTFLAVMGNFEDAEKAYVTALQSEGSAWKENEAYMESIEAHQAKLKQEWEELVLSKPIEDLEKALLNAGTALLKFANSDIGQTIIKATAFVTVTGLLVTNIIKIPSALSTWIVTQYGLNASITAGTIATDLFTKAILANPIFWGAVAVAGVVALVKVLDAFYVTMEEQLELLKEANQQLEQTQSECDSLIEKINQVEEAIEDINKRKLEITDPQDIENLNKESEELKSQEALLKSQLALKEAQLKLDREKALREANITQQTTVDYTGFNNNVNSYNYGSKTKERGLLGEALKQEVSNVAAYEAQIKALENELNSYSTTELETSEAAQESAQKLQDLKDEYIDAQEVMNNHAEILLGIQESGATLNEVNQEGLDCWKQYEGVLEETSTATNKSKEALKAQIEALEDTDEEIDGVSDAFEKAVKPLSDIENNYSLVSKAMKEFNENGGISASTVKKLSELDSKWLAVLQMKDGQLTIDKDLVLSLAEAEKDQAIASLQAQASQDMYNVSIGNLESLSPIAQQAISEITTETEESAQAAKQAAAAHFLEAEALDYKRQIAENGIYSGNTQQAYDMINAIMSKYQGLIDNMNDWTLDFGTTSSKTSKSTKDAWKEAFEEEQRLLKHSLEMNEITEIEYYEKLKDLNEKYFGEVSGNHKKYLKEYQENEEEIYKGLKSIYDKVKDYLKEAVEQGYEKAINAIKKEEKKLLAEIKSQIEALKKEKKHVLDGIKDEVNALKRQKEEAQKYYNDQIDALKRENEEIEQQNELLEYQQALQQAKSKKVMVFQEGKFQLTEDESAVAQAEQNLAQYENKAAYEKQIQELEDLRDATVESLEERIQALEDYYDYMEDYYDRQIDSMEEYYNQVEEQYEKQIEALQTELDTFKEGYQKAEDLENAKLAATVLAANEEASVWQKRLENLATAVSEYNRILDMIGEGNVQSTFAAKAIVSQASNKMSEVESSIGRRASGDASFKGDEIALVGESPNAELVLGSHINQSLGGGSLMNLSKGSGIVNAESTSTLAGLLNGLASPTSVSNSRSVQQNFTFGNISLPNVTDGNSFVKALSTQFNNYAIQYGNTTRR